MYCSFYVDPTSKGKLLTSPFRNWKKARELMGNHFYNIRKDATKGAQGHETHIGCTAKVMALKDDILRKQVGIVNDR